MTKGTLIRMVGPVLDVRFRPSEVPPIHTLLYVVDGERRVAVEVHVAYVLWRLRSYTHYRRRYAKALPALRYGNSAAGVKRGCTGCPHGGRDWLQTSRASFAGIGYRNHAAYEPDWRVICLILAISTSSSGRVWWM